MLNTTKYRWKGKIVTKKAYLKRIESQKLGLSRRKVPLIVESVENCSTSDPKAHPVAAEKNICDGERMVDLIHLGKQLWCGSCHETLSLECIESERKSGCASFLMIRCHKCLLINEVTTGKQKPSTDKRATNFNINYKFVNGALHSGISWTNLRKFFSSMNIPFINFKTFKKYEHEIGSPAEEVAKSSCAEASVKLEKAEFDD